MLKRYAIAGGRLTPVDQEPAVAWFFSPPDEQERKLLVDTHKLDEHTLASAMDPDEVARLEFEPEHVAMIFKRPRNYSAEDKFLFKVMSVGFFLFRDRLVVVLPEDISILNGKPLQKIGSPTDVLLRLVSRTVAHFVEHLKIITMVSDSLEQKISKSIENRHLLNLFTLEKSLVYYLAAINANSIVIDKLRNAAPRVGFTQEQVEFLEDVAIENQQCYRQAEIYSNILSSMMESYASIVNNNLSVLMKTLNIITICLMVPTLVVSAFSMNVAIPMQKNPSAFWIILRLALAAMFGFMAFWRFKRW